MDSGFFFVKQMFNNVFQIMVGKHKTNAHRQQLKAAYEPKKKKTLLHLPSGTNKRKRDSIEEEDEFYGFQDVPSSESAHCRRAKIRRDRSPIITRSKTAQVS